MQITLPNFISGWETIHSNLKMESPSSMGILVLRVYDLILNWNAIGYKDPSNITSILDVEQSLLYFIFMSGANHTCESVMRRIFAFYFLLQIILEAIVFSS